MKENIWIWNHYATNMFKDQAGRHFWFAENLIQSGYKPTIFCASTVHNSSESINKNENKYVRDSVKGIPFVFIETHKYKGNGKQRINNMLRFYKNILKVAEEYADLYGKPDVIVASSVHPLTLVAGIKTAKKFGIPCICEVRDLWPESIVAYGLLRKNNLFTKLLYQGEKWIYKKADSIIMTWEGGKQYIIDQGWDKDINLDKVKYLSNGVDVDVFDRNSNEYIIDDADLNNIHFKNIIYAGSIRKVNNISLLLDAAKLVQDQGYTNIRFLIYGSGDETEYLKERCKTEHIDNVIFKGRVDKKYIPSILKKAHVNILHNSSTSLDVYGQSQNKFFEYLAAGKSIVQTYTTGYSICEKYNCGLSAQKQTADEVANIVIKACTDAALSECMGKNARMASFEYDMKRLTSKFINIIEEV